MFERHLAKTLNLIVLSSLERATQIKYLIILHYATQVDLGKVLKHPKAYILPQNVCIKGISILQTLRKAGRNISEVQVNIGAALGTQGQSGFIMQK